MYESKYRSNIYRYLYLNKLEYEGIDVLRYIR